MWTNGDAGRSLGTDRRRGAAAVGRGGLRHSQRVAKVKPTAMKPMPTIRFF